MPQVFDRRCWLRMEKHNHCVFSRWPTSCKILSKSFDSQWPPTSASRVAFFTTFLVRVSNFLSSEMISHCLFNELFKKSSLWVTRHLSLQTMVSTMVSSSPEVNHFYCSHSLPTWAAPVTPVSSADRRGEYKSERGRVTANSCHLTFTEKTVIVIPASSSWLWRLETLTWTPPTSAPLTWRTWGGCCLQSSSSLGNCHSWKSSSRRSITSRCSKQNSNPKELKWRKRTEGRSPIAYSLVPENTCSFVHFCV